MAFNRGDLFKMNRRLPPAPIITSPDSGSVEEGEQLSFVLTCNQTVTWSIVGGADQSSFEVSGSTLRWTGNGTKAYVPGGANTYEVVVQALNATTLRYTTQTITICVDETPVTQFSSVTLRVGYLTRASSGSVPLDNPGTGVLNSGTVTSWSLVRTSGDSGVWPTPITSGRTPAPSRALTSADGGTSAVYEIWADTGSGLANTTRTLTISVQSAAESAGAFTVSAKNDIDSTASTGLRNASVIGTVGGKRIEVQRGSDAAWANSNFGTSAGNADIMRVRGFKTHTGVCTITNSDDAHPARVGRIYLEDSINFRITGLTLCYGLTQWPENGVSASTQSSRQSVVAVYLTNSSGPVSGIEIDSNTFGAPTGYDDNSQWISGIDVRGSTYPNWISDINVHDNTFTKVRQGVSGGAWTSVSISTNSIITFCGDAISPLTSNGGTDITVEYNYIAAPMTLPTSTGTHPDFIQVGSTNCLNDAERIKIRYNICNTNGGEKTAQGPFFNDIGYWGSTSGGHPAGDLLSNGQYLTGYQCVDCEAHNNIYIGGFTNGLTLDYGTGWLVYNNTLVRGAMVEIADQTSFGDPIVRPTVLTNTVTSAAVTSAGTYAGNVSHSTISSGSGMTLTDNINMGASPGGGVAHEAALYAFLDVYVQDSSDIADEAGVLAGYRAKVGGPLDLGGGKYAGALNPDGTWADAR